MEAGFWVAPLAGGLMIGVAAAVMLLVNGRVMGASGILARAVFHDDEGGTERRAFVLGMVLTGILGSMVWPEAFAYEVSRSAGAMMFAGLLVGFGTRLGSGCTSGHGVCGNARFSGRSMTATVTFIAVGMVTVFATRTLLGGSF